MGCEKLCELLFELPIAYAVVTELEGRCKTVSQGGLPIEWRRVGQNLV